MVLQIEILPSLEVRQIRLLRSSGNSLYDEAVQAAVREMRRFPPLPKGAAFADYRRVTMSFRPKE
ncbi:Gram-negative bacterial tonB protein [compost metagenome]